MVVKSVNIWMPQQKYKHAVSHVKERGHNGILYVQKHHCRVKVKNEHILYLKCQTKKVYRVQLTTVQLKHVRARSDDNRDRTRLE